ncbi:MAG: hypothetical protein ACTSU3_05930 [Candidatus Thorarchaeota archaeon]
MQPSEQPEKAEEFDRTMYLEILRESSPVKRYVSRGDMPDSIDIEGPHEDVDRAIYRLLRFVMDDGTPRFQPILGSAGMGKTHLYWALKDREKTFEKGQYLAVYIPSPPAPIRVPLHFHACLVDEAGEKLFENAVDMLITKFGGLKGMTHEIYDYSYALERLLVDYPGISADVVKVILRYRLDPGNRDLARRWLFGDALSDDETDQLDVRTILEEDDVTMATLKLLLEGSEVPIVLFIDEMEGPYNTHGEEGERHFLEIIKRIYNECKNVLIVTSCLTEIWDRIYEIADAPTRSRMEKPVSLRHFTKEDISTFVSETMSRYWNEQNIDAPPSLLFPLDENDVNEAFTESEGNPREAIRFVINRIDSILFGESAKPIEEQADYVIKLTASVVISAIAKGLEIVGKKSGVSVQLVVAKGIANKQATAVLTFRKDGRSHQVCIDVANVKDWNRSGGVAAYYSVKRLQKMLDSKEADLCIVAVPEATSGAKFQALRDDIGEKLKTITFDEDSAIALVETTTQNKIGPEQIELFKDIVTGLFE